VCHKQIDGLLTPDVTYPLILEIVAYSSVLSVKIVWAEGNHLEPISENQGYFYTPLGGKDPPTPVGRRHPPIFHFLLMILNVNLCFERVYTPLQISTPTLPPHFKFLEITLVKTVWEEWEGESYIYIYTTVVPIITSSWCWRNEMHICQYVGLLYLSLQLFSYCPETNANDNQSRWLDSNRPVGRQCPTQKEINPVYKANYTI